MKTMPYKLAQSFFTYFAASKQRTDEKLDGAMDDCLAQAGVTWEDLDLVVLRAKPIVAHGGPPLERVSIERLQPIFRALEGVGTIEDAFAAAGIPLLDIGTIELMKAAIKK